MKELEYKGYDMFLLHHLKPNMDSSTKILFIDNDSFFARIYAKKFAEHGWQTDVAATGDIGLRSASSNKPSWIILDLLLPGKDGFRVLEELKENEETAMIPVFILTDLCEPEDIERCQKLGACGYAIKAHTHPMDIIRKFIEL